MNNPYIVMHFSRFHYRNGAPNLEFFESEEAARASIGNVLVLWHEDVLLNDGESRVEHRADNEYVYFDEWGYERERMMLARRV